MLEYKTVSMYGSSDYCRGWNDAVKEMPKWISVKEKMPAKGEKVLLYIPEREGCKQHGMYLGEAGEVEADPKGEHNFWGLPTPGSNWGIDGWSYFEEPIVTHWMLLPDAPEEDNKTIVFSKKKWMEYPLPEDVRERSLQSGWVDECDGKPVENRLCGQFLIADACCVDADEWEAYGDE